MDNHIPVVVAVGSVAVGSHPVDPVGTLHHKGTAVAG